MSFEWAQANTPDLSFSETLHGSGTLRRGMNRIELSTFTITRFLLDPSQPWRFDAVATTDNDDHIAVVASSEGGMLPRFMGVTQNGTRIRARLIWAQRRPGSVIEGTLQALDENIERVDGSIDRQSVLISFSSTVVASLPGNWNRAAWAKARGRGERRARKPLQVTLGGQQYSFASLSEQRHATVAGTPSIVTVPYCALVRNNRSKKHVRQPKDLIEAVQPELDDLCVIMSLLVRNPVSWTRIAVHSRITVSPTHKPAYHFSGRYRQSATFDVARNVQQVVDPENVDALGLDRMLKTLRSLPYADATRRTILYLVESYRSTYLHYSVLNAFTALETLINGISASEGTDSVIDDSTFALLRTELQASIKSFAKANGIGAPTRAELYAKLGEIRRPALVPRIVEIVNRLGVEPDELWQYDGRARRKKLGQRLGEAYARRNRLVHTGSIESAFDAQGDFLRVHALTELLVFKILGVSEDWFNPLGWYPLMQHGRQGRPQPDPSKDESDDLLI